MDGWEEKAAFDIEMTVDNSPTCCDDCSNECTDDELAYCGECDSLVCWACYYAYHMHDAEGSE